MEKEPTQYFDGEQAENFEKDIPNLKDSMERQREKQGEAFGRNVEVRAIFLRHAEKKFPRSENEVSLSVNGIKKSEELGKKLNEKNRIEGEYSDTARTKKTTEEIVNNSPTENKLKLKERDELAFHCSDNFMDETTKHVEKILGESYESLTEDEKKETEIRATTHGVDYYLNFKDERPDEETYSPVETAATVAQRLDTAIRKADRLHSGSKIDSVFISHDYVVAAFLKEIMIRETEDGEKIRGFISLDEMGGPIKFLEGLEIITKTDNDGKKSIDLLFRGQKYELDIKRFKELLRIASKLEQKAEKNK